MVLRVWAWLPCQGLRRGSSKDHNIFFATSNELVSGKRKEAREACLYTRRDVHIEAFDIDGRMVSPDAGKCVRFT